MRKILVLYICLVLLAIVFDALPQNEVSAEVIGHSVEGRPIFLVHKGFGPRVLITAGMHGNEKIGTHMLWHALEELHGFEFLIIPVVNPDGFAANQRTNAHGVDINRNFDFEWEKGYDKYGGKGDAPFSEPETQIVKSVIELYNPQIVIDIHGMPSLNYKTWVIKPAHVHSIPALTGFSTKELYTGNYPTYSSKGGWFINYASANGAQAFLIEIPDARVKNLNYSYAEDVLIELLKFLRKQTY